MPWYKTLLNYLTQKTTWVGLFSILASFGIVLRPDLTDAIIACALGIAGLIAVLVDENKGTTGNE